MSGLRGVPHADLNDLDRPTRSAQDLATIACQHIHRAATDRTKPEQTNLDWFQNNDPLLQRITGAKGADHSESADLLSIFRGVCLPLLEMVFSGPHHGQPD